MSICPQIASLRFRAANKNRVRKHYQLARVYLGAIIVEEDHIAKETSDFLFLSFQPSPAATPSPHFSCSFEAPAAAAGHRVLISCLGVKNSSRKSATHSESRAICCCELVWPGATKPLVSQYFDFLFKNKAAVVNPSG